MLCSACQGCALLQAGQSKEAVAPAGPLLTGMSRMCATCSRSSSTHPSRQQPPVRLVAPDCTFSVHLYLLGPVQSMYVALVVWHKAPHVQHQRCTLRCWMPALAATSALSCLTVMLGMTYSITMRQLGRRHVAVRMHPHALSSSRCSEQGTGKRLRENDRLHLRLLEACSRHCWAACTGQQHQALQTYQKPQTSLPCFLFGHRGQPD